MFKLNYFYFSIILDDNVYMDGVVREVKQWCLGNSWNC